MIRPLLFLFSMLIPIQVTADNPALEQDPRQAEEGIAEVGDPVPVREVIYLSGTDKDHTKTWEFFCTGGCNSGQWTTIQVPSCWEQQGFGSYNYGRDYVTYGRAVRYSDEKGLYRHRFVVPDAWKERKVRIVFEGSMTDTEVKINGTPAGEVHRGAFYRFGYDITGLLRFGKENLLEVTVSKQSEDPSVNSAERYADYWIFGGIFRPVYLEAYPLPHIPQAAVWGTASGVFHARVELSSVEAGIRVVARILDPAGNLAGTCSTVATGGNAPVSLQATLLRPLMWTAETPHLYSAVISLKRGEEILYRMEEKFGFRTVEIRHGDGIYLNGTKILMKGINRHAFWPETGRTLSREVDLMDVQLMKAMNMNAVRCSHYPPDRSFLEICDSLGLYVLDELAGWQNAYSTEAGEKLVREMVLRDRNHPSVIFWSNGNEGGTNKKLDDDFLKYDPSGRQVVHCHHRPGNDFNGIETNHYESYQSTARILEDSLIYMTTEFLHAQNDGGGGAGLRDYWELMYGSERSGGGFLWALLDEGLVRTDLGGAIDVNLVNAPDGVLGPHREKEGSFYAIREIFSPVVISAGPDAGRAEENVLTEDFDGTFLAENRFFFTNLQHCTFRWKLLDFPTPQEQLSGHRVLARGEVLGPDLEPGEKGTLQIGLPGDWQGAGGLRLEAFDPAGLEVMEWTWPVGESLKWLEAFNGGGDFPPVSMEESDSLITLSANGITVTFSKEEGLLREVKNNGQRTISFRNGPVPCQGDAVLEGIDQSRDEKRFHLVFRYSGALDRVAWTMHPDGWVEMNYSYTLSGEHPFAGVSFDFEEGNVMSARWFGEGPYRVWKNRMDGTTMDVWAKAYNNTMAGSSPWQFPEFKGYHAGVRWMELNTLDGKILMAASDPLFVRLFEFYAFPDPTAYPPLPPGDLSFLDAIPPIGTKMSTGLNASAESTGPSGLPNSLDGTFEHTLYFNFGILP